MSWIDAFLNAAMPMGGMGPVNVLRTDGAKVFAGMYALYCGVVELIAIGIFAAPIVHRFRHHFHLEAEKSAWAKRFSTLKALGAKTYPVRA